MPFLHRARRIFNLPDIPVWLSQRRSYSRQTPATCTNNLPRTISSSHSFRFSSSFQVTTICSTRRTFSTASESDTRDLFEYTCGRWIVNEELRRAERARYFNISHLLFLAAQSVNRSPEDIECFGKYAECRFNRVLLIEMKDGFRMIAKVPYPAVVSNLYLAVASEAATLAYLRSMGIPVPEVYGYSATSNNEAGTEFIFTEFIGGENAADVCDEFGEEGIIAFLEQVVELEKRIMGITFPAGGSLYFAEDLENAPKGVSGPTRGIPLKDKQFCIGPETSRPLWFGRRSRLDVDRGPYSTAEEALKRGAEKELAFLQQFGHPLLPFHRTRRKSYNYQRQEPSEHIQNLKKYLQIVPSLFINESSSNNHFRIRHPDLRVRNIVVSRSPSDPNAWVVNGLVGWQGATVLPLSLQAGVPKELQNNDDGWDCTTQPSLPEGWDEMEEQQRESEMPLLRRRLLHYLYVALSERYNNELHHATLVNPMDMLRRRLFHNARAPWEGETIELKVALIEATRNWEELTGGGGLCPIEFDADEVREAMALNKELREMEGLMEKFIELIGVYPEGLVSDDRYEEVMGHAQELKEMIHSALDEEERKKAEMHWYFDDFDEEYR